MCDAFIGGVEVAGDCGNITETGQHSPVFVGGGDASRGGGVFAAALAFGDGGKRGERRRGGLACGGLGGDRVWRVSLVQRLFFGVARRLRRVSKNALGPSARYLFTQRLRARGWMPNTRTNCACFALPLM